MPTRIIRDGILTSTRVTQLSWEHEVFYRRLMSVVDDYGLYPANPAILRAALYPLQLDKMPERGIQRALAECESAELIQPYAVNGKDYLRLLDFKQQCKTLPKHPVPEGYTVVKLSKTSYELQQTVTSRNDLPQPVTTRNDLPQLASNRNLVGVGVEGEGEGDIDSLSSAGEMSPTLMSGTKFTQHETALINDSLTGAPSSQAVKIIRYPDFAEEVHAYLKAQPNCQLSAQELMRCAVMFFDDMESNGWADKHSNPIRDWRAAARAYLSRWMNNNFASSKHQNSKPQHSKTNDDFSY